MSTNLLRIAQRSLAIVLSSAVVLLSPGLGAYEAAAQVRAQAAPAQGTGVAVGAARTGATPSASRPSVELSLPVPGAVLPAAVLPSGLPAPATADVQRAASVDGTINLGPRASHAAPSVVGGAAPAAPGAAAARAELGRVSIGVRAVSERGPIAAMSVQAAHGAGAELQSVLTGERRSAADAGEAAAVPAAFGALAHAHLVGGGWNVSLAKPAGDSINRAVQATGEDGPSTPVPPSDGPGAPSGGGPGRKSPFWPKLLAAGIAFLPGYFLGVPLLAAGATAAGALSIAASAALAVMPFMSDSWPKAVRAVPGLLLFGLGASTVLSGVIGMGALALLGAWGLTRFGLGKSNVRRSSFDSVEVMAAFFGGIGAVTGAALVLSNPVGWLAYGVWLAYPMSMLLWIHLPEFLARGTLTVLEAAYLGTRAVYRIQSSIRRDTTQFERLRNFTEKHLKRSLWNAVWLAGIWIPIGLSEAFQFVLSLIGGAALAAVQAIPMFGWGAAHSLKDNGAFPMALTKFLGEWAHLSFDSVQGSKNSRFNPIERKLIPLANSDRLALRLVGGVGIRALQWAWLIGAVAGGTLWTAAAFFLAFRATSAEYDPVRHDPRRLTVARDDLPGDTRPDPGNPGEPGEPGKDPLLPKLIASGIGALPVYFLAYPLHVAHPTFATALFLAAGSVMALVPLFPAAAPRQLKRLPGVLLILAGAVTAVAGAAALSAAAGPVILGALAWLGTPVVVLGAVEAALAAVSSAAAVAVAALGAPAVVSADAAFIGLLSMLGGWGFLRYVGAVEGEGSTRRRSISDQEYVGAFFGALGMTTGLGLALAATASAWLGGWPFLALKAGVYLSSIPLLIHLPEWVARGAQTAFEGFFYSMRSFHRVFNFWHRGTKFDDNFERFSRYWMNKTWWNGVWLSVPWMGWVGAALMEYAAAGALGLLYGAVRAPALFLWGATHRAVPGTAFARFSAGFARAWLAKSEGSKTAVFDRLVGWLIEPMNASTSASGRPTVVAALAFLAARVMQVVWLAHVVAGQAYILPAAIVEGFRNAAKPDSEEQRRGDSPERVL